MKLSISIIKNCHNKLDIKAINNKSNYLISTSIYWLSKDVIFLRDDISGYSNIGEVDRIEGRFCIADFTSDSGNVAIHVYVVYPSNRTIPLLVGVLSGNESKIIFELPLANDDQAFARARSNGFEVNVPQFTGNYFEPDIIDMTYHDGNRRSMDRYGEVSYEKLIGKDLRLFVFIDYSAGAEDI